MFLLLLGKQHKARVLDMITLKIMTIHLGHT